MKYSPPDFGKADDASRGHSDRKTFLINTLGVLLAAVALYYVVGLSADFLSGYIPSSLEAKLGRRQNKATPHQVEALKEANEILSTFSEELALRPLSYSIQLVESDTPNAFAVPGGWIVLTSGLLKRLKTQEGLAMVIGHELGHHDLRHSVKRMGRTLFFGIASGFIFGDFFASLGEITAKAAVLRYSQEQEFEADTFGLEAVLKCLPKTENALEFFKTLDDTKTAGRWQAMLSTHPYSQKRLRRLQQRIQLHQTSP